jgi:NADPH:quinone reductase-like Zn-dependent oxidoreductase
MRRRQSPPYVKYGDGRPCTKSSGSAAVMRGFCLVRAVRIHEDGGPDVLRYEEIPDPEPGAGEVLVELRAAGLNHLDVWVRRGLPSVPKPRILGADGAGVVAALGDAVGGFAPGDRVVLNPGIAHDGRITVVGEHTDGTYCELKALPAAQLYPLDDALSFEEGAAFPLVFETAYRMLVTKAALLEGEWVLIWGIGGGVALAVFELARALGARTIVTSSSREKLERARALGADAAVSHSEDDVVAAVKEATGGRGADVVVETVGEATWERSLGAAAQEGRIVVCGATTGHSPPARLYRLWWKQLAVYGSTMGLPGDFEAAYDLIRAGRARIHVDSVFPLAEAAKAHERLESGAQFGKVVLSIPS